MPKKNYNQNQVTFLIKRTLLKIFAACTLITTSALQFRLCQWRIQSTNLGGGGTPKVFKIDDLVFFLLMRPTIFRNFSWGGRGGNIQTFS